MQQFKGTGVALVTPFNNDLSLDLDGLSRVIEHSIDGGVEYLVVLGTTAENATLTQEEKEQVIKRSIEVNKNRVPLMLGIGGNNTAHIIQELKERDLFEFDGVLSVSPYYNRPSQAGIYAHYEAISKASPLPILLYNVPGRTGSNMLPETVLKLGRDFDNIFGIKEAAGDITQMLRLLKDKPEGFMVISGDDMLAAPTVTAGGDGVISVLGQGIPDVLSDMIRDGLSGDQAMAYSKHFRLMPAIDLIFAEGNPAGIKALLAQKGLCLPVVRLPLVQASENLNDKIATYLKAL
ncbi:4-hydroxy-tetrahydrodipicolinate synthase [Leeuwenhoekiella sp. A16]|uniref:4-hydroxy-tetrahydrodipicolinate synthase n=1 Tax=unclassified Leeuwenhoekiella TaxID=2615029 RepID=UPI003A7F8E62